MEHFFRRIITVLCCSSALLATASSYAQPNTPMKLTIPAFANGAPIPAEYTFCIPAPTGHKQMGKNRNPQLVWSDLPAGTQSLAIIAVDPDVPVEKSNVNKAGVTLAKDLARKDFYHWVLIDIPPSLHQISAGQDSDGVVAHGKPPGPTAYGMRGVNDFTIAFATDKNMTGEYGGYDGPCPPWNDELLHHYHFTLYALDVKTLGLTGNFDGRAAMAAMQGHILSQKEWVGIYSLYNQAKNL